MKNLMQKPERLDKVLTLIALASHNPERFPSPFGYLQYDGKQTAMFHRLRRLYPEDEVEDWDVGSYAMSDLRDLVNAGRIKLVARGGYTWVVLASVPAPLEEIVDRPINACNTYQWDGVDRLTPLLGDDEDLEDDVEWIRRRENGVLVEVVPRGKP